MMQVEPVNLEVTLPSTHVKMVAMQPFVRLSDDEPFRWPDDGKKDEQIQAIRRTLDIAKSERITHFTLFPEYAIPGLDGVGAIDEVVTRSNGWPNGAIIMGGIDGLNKSEYDALCSQQSTVCHTLNEPQRVQDDEWVNCSVTWVKDDDGLVMKYVQPKTRPCWLEEMIHEKEMFRGSCVYLYSSKYGYNGQNYPCSFLSLVCYDWIAQHDCLPVTHQVLDFLNRGAPIRLDWVFALQYNKKPNNHTFLNSTSDFLGDPQYQNVIRNDTAVIFINSATSPKPCRHQQDNFGFTSIVYHPRANVVCDVVRPRPTVSMKPQKYRNSTILNCCKDTVFREMGACIHSFKVAVSRFLPPDTTGRSLPIRGARVHPINDGLTDPRLPDKAVPASVKWVNDNLDIAPRLGDSYSGRPLSPHAASSHDNVSKELQWLKASKLQNNIHYATCNQSEEKWQDADEWGNDEKQALEHILHTITIMGIADTDINIKESVLHARIMLEDKIIELVAIKGNDHIECKKHFDANYVRHINHKKLIISRDSDNSEVLKRYTEKVTEGIIGEQNEGDKYTATHYSIFQRGYRDLLVDFQKSSSPQQLAERISSYVN